MITWALILPDSSIIAHALVSVNILFISAVGKLNPTLLAHSCTRVYHVYHECFRSFHEYSSTIFAMAPKKKGNKKGNEDWEAELGEGPIAAATQATKDADTAHDVGDEAADLDGGGLLAALRKNKAKRKQKGKPVEEEVQEGEDPSETNGIQDLATKAPTEADAEDLFSNQISKVKGAKGKQGKKVGTLAPNEDGQASDDEGGTLRSKKEKDKEKKEREKQRKKEQVGCPGC